MTPPGLDTLPHHAAALPSLPSVVTYLMQTLNEEQTDVDALLQHLNSDPAIVARLLAAANSVATGVSTRIYSARQALLILGVDRVVGIIMASALVHRYDAWNADFDTRLLWQHSLGVAVCARVLAEDAGVNPELAFTAGLLHDIGQLLMFVASPEDYVGVLAEHRESMAPIVEVERRRFGYDHCAAGQKLGESWQLPRELISAIAAHHDPDAFPCTVGHLVHVSEVLSHALDLGEPANNRVPDLSDRSLILLGLSLPRIARRLAEIEARYDGLRLALGI